MTITTIGVNAPFNDFERGYCKEGEYLTQYIKLPSEKEYARGAGQAINDFNYYGMEWLYNHICDEAFQSLDMDIDSPFTQGYYNQACYLTKGFS